jgi:hypothetical protein
MQRKVSWMMLSSVAFIVMIAITSCVMMPVAWTPGRTLLTYADAAAKDLVAAADARVTNVETNLKTSIESAIKPLKEEITRLRASKPTNLWVIYLISGLALVVGPAIGYFAKQLIGGIILAAGGAAGIAWLQFNERYPWAMWVILGVITLAVGYLVFDYIYAKRKKENAEAALDAINPVIEELEPKQKGPKPSGPMKAAIADNAFEAGTTSQVITAVADSKIRTS